MRLTTTGPVVVVADPEAWPLIADADPGWARAGEARREVLPMASALSVFGGDGQTHAAARERVADLFSEAAVGQRGPGIARVAESHIAQWPRGRPFRLLPRMRLLADEIFVREILGVSTEPRAQALARAIGRMLWTPGNPPLTVPGADDGLLGAAVDLLYRRRRAPVAELLKAEMEDRRRAGHPGPGVIGMLLADEPDRPDELLVEELLALLMAAQEPMAAALTWLHLRTGAHPAVRERLAEEGADSPYADAVVRETLRLHPSAVGVLRRITVNTTVCGHPIPAGTTLIVPIPLIQRDGRWFEEPDSFLPERQLDHAAAEDALLPFGGGARRCLGEALARTEIGTVLTATLRRVRLRPLAAEAERMVLRATILVPRRSGLVIARAA